MYASVEISEKKVRRLDSTNRQWIFEKTWHQQKYDDLPHPPGKGMVNGESALYLGHNYFIEIAATDSGKIKFAQKFFVPADLANGKPEAFRDW